MQVIQPSLEDIQNAVNIAVQCVVDVGQYVQLWTIPSPASSLSNTPRSNESNHIHNYTLKNLHSNSSSVHVLVLVHVHVHVVDNVQYCVHCT